MLYCTVRRTEKRSGLVELDRRPPPLSSIMRMTDYSISVTRRHIRSLRLRILILLSARNRAPFFLIVRFNRRLRELRRHERLLLTRSLRIALHEFDLDAIDDRTALREFRFPVSEIKNRVVSLIGWGLRQHTSRNRYLCDATLATCVVLRRLASPARWEDLEPLFGKHRAQLSEIFWEALENFVQLRKNTVMTWRSDLMLARAPLYASYIARVAPLQKCVAYLDCTKMKVARPGGPNANQRALYSGHKRTWCFKFQTLSTPDGLIFNLFGPEDGRRHDLTLYSKSELDSTLEQNLMIGGQRYYVYADQAYMLRPWLQIGYERNNITPHQQEFNSSNNAARTAVEWSYKDLRQAWTAVDFQRKMRVRESPIAVKFIAAVILWNAKVVLGHGSQTRAYFTDDPSDMIDPPTWAQYFPGV